MSVPQLKKHIDQAMGRTKADLVIKNVTLLDVASGEEILTDIAIADNKIVGTLEQGESGYEGVEVIDGTGLTAVPGFIDTHVHVESSLITPDEFDRCVTPKGTTTAICDPHEISNVLGEEGLEYFIKASEVTVMDLFVQLSSCVPATNLETSGASLDAKALLQFRDHHNVIGLAEFMNIGGVLGQDEEVLEKLSAFADGHIDGHNPGILGKALNAMASCGIRNCHESTSAPEAHEKMQKGLHVLMREGTAAKDIDEIHSVLNPFTSPFVSLCTDDRNPLDIAEEGHLDHIIRKLIKHGHSPAEVYRAASWSAAQQFGLHQNTGKWNKRGLIAPGWQADIVLLSDVDNCEIHSVIKNGALVTDEKFDARPQVAPVGLNSVHVKEVNADDFAIKIDTQDKTQQIDVIGLEAGSIVTKHLTETVDVQPDGTIENDFNKDLLKLAVIERHGINGNMAKAFVQGFGIKNGAIATSIGHDSHNITVVGASDEDMAVAVNRLREINGGMVVVKDGVVEGELQLEIAGLMAKDKSYEEVKVELEALREAATHLNSSIHEPFMLLAFLPLCVIPELKLTDFGLVRFNPAGGDEGPVLIQDQRKNNIQPS